VRRLSTLAIVSYSVPVFVMVVGMRLSDPSQWDAVLQASMYVGVAVIALWAAVSWWMGCNRLYVVSVGDRPRWCVECGYPYDEGAQPSVCPECGADLLRFGALGKGRQVEATAIVMAMHLAAMLLYSMMLLRMGP